MTGESPRNDKRDRRNGCWRKVQYEAEAPALAEAARLSGVQHAEVHTYLCPWTEPGDPPHWHVGHPPRPRPETLDERIVQRLAVIERHAADGWRLTAWQTAYKEDVEPLAADVEQAQRHADEAHARYTDLQARSQGWLDQAKAGAETAERERDRLHADVEFRKAQIVELIEQRDELVTALSELLGAAYVIVNPDAAYHEKSDAIRRTVPVANQLVERYRRSARNAARPPEVHDA